MSVGHYEYPERATLPECPVLSCLYTPWVEREVFRDFLMDNLDFTPTMCSSEYGCESGGGYWGSRISYECRDLGNVQCCVKSSLDVISKKRPPQKNASVKCKSRLKRGSLLILIAICISSFPCVLSSERVSKAIRTFEFRRNHGETRKDVGVEFAGEFFSFLIG